MQNEPLSSSTYSVSLPAFEGPLDLLLHLCQKHELDILDIPVAFVTEKYLEYLGLMKLLDLDVASDYLVMAATLAHIKSKMLLPSLPVGQDDGDLEDGEDPRQALIRRLLEYQKYKLAGQQLDARGVAGRDVFLRGAPTERAVSVGLPPLAETSLFVLMDAFQQILSRAQEGFTHDVVPDRISLADRMHELVDILTERGRASLVELFDGIFTRIEMVTTFLALLEMTRLRMVRLFQSEPLAPLYIEFVAELNPVPRENLRTIESTTGGA